VEPAGRRAGYLPQIDAMKGVAILAVLALHSAPNDLWLATWSAFHIGQAVPVFMCLSGFVVAWTFDERGRSYREYLRSRLSRLAPAYGVTWALGAAAVIVAGGGLTVGMVAGGALGVLPIRGPGAYYLPLLLQFTLVAPFLLRWARARGWRTVWYSMIAAQALDVALVFSGAAQVLPFAYSALVVRYLPVVMAGMMLAIGRGSDTPPPRRFAIAAAIGALLLLILQLGAMGLVPGFDPVVLGSWGFSAPVTQGYAAMLVAWGLGSRLGAGALRALGESSYHIFLAQVLVFGAQIPARIAGLVLPGRDQSALWWTVAFCAAILFAAVPGMLFAASERMVRSRLRPSRA